MILPIRPDKPEQRVNSTSSTGRSAANRSLNGNERSSLEMRVTRDEVYFRVDAENGNFLTAIVAILAGACVVVAFILS